MEGKGQKTHHDHRYGHLRDEGFTFIDEKVKSLKLRPEGRNWNAYPGGTADIEERSGKCYRKTILD